MLEEDRKSKLSTEGLTEQYTESQCRGSVTTWQGGVPSLVPGEEWSMERGMKWNQSVISSPNPGTSPI